MPAGAPVMLPNTGKLWTTAIISIVWTQFPILWKDQNKLIHGHNQTTHNLTKQPNIELQDAEITQQPRQITPTRQRPLHGVS